MQIDLAAIAATATADTETAPHQPLDRRRMLRLGAAAAAGGAFAFGKNLLDPSHASAATGAMQYGALNDATTSGTSLTSSQTGPSNATLLLDNTGTTSPIALRASIVASGATSANAIVATNSGIGRALNASTLHATNTAEVILATQSGTGPGIVIDLVNGASTGTGVAVHHDGLGGGITASLTEATNAAAGLAIDHAGIGPGIAVTMAEPTTIEPGVDIAYDGQGSAVKLAAGSLGRAITATSSSDEHVIDINKTGDVGSGVHVVMNTGFAASAFSAEMNSPGFGYSATGEGGGLSVALDANHAAAGLSVSVKSAPGAIITSDATNSNEGLYVNQNGTGPAGLFEFANPSSATAALKTTSDSTAGRVIDARNTNTGTGSAVYATHAGSGTAVEAKSTAGRGVVASGEAAQVRLYPSTAATHPSGGKRGDLFCDRSGRLWFCKRPGTWKQIA